MILKPPYPWFGGKAKIAPVIWRAFGEISNYSEPFFGGGAVFLARPGWTAETRWTETVNDINAWLTNFWRAVKADPETVAEYAADPVSELDLHARGDALFYKGVKLSERHDKATLLPDAFCEALRSDPEWYDAKVAGWWVWGQSSWIGDNWGRMECRSLPALASGCEGINRVWRSRPSLTQNGIHRKRPSLASGGKGINREVSGEIERKRPYLSRGGRGVARQMPHVANIGQGVNRTLPQLGAGGRGVGRKCYRETTITEYMRALSERVSCVRICCGDWRRVLGPTPTVHNGLTGVFLDPPYAVSDRDECYGENESKTIAHDVRQWCIENGGNKRLRIALCGYEEHEELSAHGWRRHAWRAQGGYGNQKKTGNQNNRREVVWFSPHCLPLELANCKMLWEKS